ncbi:ABC transporter permease [Crossiella cryophila]|uniref:Transport permease protein n=1 Tax=Crossiella cryophila TaxID=43355 RepID=A0A7W7G029_9PSEU|nr:ABC transporter permease [Crossiella cryophila]MBB4681774.1 ABC-2 type transport system permease protein [Crossiella cryophila]
MTALTRLSATELRLFLRDPAAVVLSLGLGPILLIVFGSIPFFREPQAAYGGARIVDFYLPTLISMSVAMIGLSLLSGSLANYRELGVLRRLATTPVPPVRLLTAQLLVHLLMVTVSLVLLIGLGKVVADVPLPGNPVAFALSFLLATLAVFGIGLLIAALAPTTKSAQGIGTVAFFPLMFLAGLWTPGPLMPELVRRIGEFSPIGAGTQAMQAAWSGGWPNPLHLLVAAGFAAAALFGATKLFRWQ